MTPPPTTTIPARHISCGPNHMLTTRIYCTDCAVYLSLTFVMYKK